MKPKQTRRSTAHSSLLGDITSDGVNVDWDKLAKKLNAMEKAMQWIGAKRMAEPPKPRRRAK